MQPDILSNGVGAGHPHADGATGNYRAAVDRLMTLPDFEKHSRAGQPPDFHLRRMQMLMDECGSPHLKIPAIHVAGSKGKGSTAALITSALTANGLKVGLYTSPSLHTVRERIRVGLEPISESEFATLVDRMWPAVEAVARNGEAGNVSYFEIMTAMAWSHFFQIGADVQVIEVGLGGRLDSTNLLQPAVSVITPVGLDHTAVLGETIAAIASEKAGIIKPSTPVIVGRQSPEAADVIKIKAKECAAPLIDALESVKQRYAAAPNGPGSGQDVMLEGAFGAYRFNLPLAGKHQVDNACVAVAAIESFDEREAVSSTEATCRGLAATRWPGRIQVLDAGLNGTPALLVDGAHTAESAAALVNTVNEMFPRRRKTILIYGGSGGHDFSATAAVLNRLDPHVVVTRSRHPKSVDSQSVASALVSDNVNVASRTDTTRTALAEARRLAGSQDLIIGAGSLAIAAEIIEIENGMEPEYYPTLNVGAR